MLDIQVTLPIKLEDVMDSSLAGALDIDSSDPSTFCGASLDSAPSRVDFSKFSPSSNHKSGLRSAPDGREGLGHQQTRTCG